MNDKRHSFIWHLALNVCTFVICFAIVVTAYLYYLSTLPTFVTPELLQLYDQVISLLSNYVKHLNLLLTC